VTLGRIAVAEEAADAAGDLERRIAADAIAERDREILRQRVPLVEVDVGELVAEHVVGVHAVAEGAKLHGDLDQAEAILELDDELASRGEAPVHFEPGRSRGKTFQQEGIVAFHKLTYLLRHTPST
jgi:hypothetical protein